MAYSPPELQLKAAQLFEPQLAQAVIAEIGKDALRAATENDVPATTESIATGYLADAFYDKLAVGQISGLPTVTWNYIDLFIFRPDAKAPFQYKRANGTTITPRLMETDGGSTPQILRGLQKFSSWGYAPAFVVHDWLYTAKKCGYAPDNGFAFEETATIMAEIMKTLTEVGYTDYQGKTVKLPKLEDTIYLMYLGVTSSVARQVWDDNSTIHCMASPGV